MIAADTLAHSGGGAVRLTRPNLLVRLSTSGNRAALTVTGGRGTATYDGTVHRNGYAVSGLVAGDSAIGVSGLASGRNPGSYRDALSGATGNGLSNDAISYVNGGLTVDLAALTVTAGNVFKHYDASSWSGAVGVTYDRLQGGDTAASLRGRLTLSGTAFCAVDPGQYAITASGLSSQNYRISFREGALWIAAPSHRLAMRPPMTEEMPRFHLRMSKHDIALTRITAAWAQETCVLYPTDKASIEVSNVLPGRKEHIHTSAVCPPGAGLPRQA